MKSQIKIIPNPEVEESKKGDFFEDLMRHIFETQRYSITQRVNFTGMEIDLIGKHKDRNECTYIECKAKESLSTDEIRTFSFNVDFKKAEFGYFLSCVEFEHQVAGIINEMSKREEYKNLYFWGPDKILELLESANLIKALETQEVTKKKLMITKCILAYTFFGNFYVLILAKDIVPAYFCIYNASNNNIVDDEKVIANLKEKILDIGDLELISLAQEEKSITQPFSSETIAEVQESENWYDYLPASAKYFVGMEDLKKDIFGFIEQIRKKKTERRIFYIVGKSGWGKSSLLTYIRGKCKNKFYRKHYFVLVVDARTASSNNFVALAFNKLIEKAKEANFLPKNCINKKLNITSSFDILDSKAIKKLLNNLKKHHKLLIIIFDQFEDVFRNNIVFRAFHKFLLDVAGMQLNLVVGFSWKSEINIPIDHEGYHLWQQAKNLAFCITMREFNPKETNGIIKQLEKSLGNPIQLELKRRLVEGSQGFPWLTKKLCIHIYKQIRGGKTIEDLIDEELNCEALFKNDLEELSTDESKALNYIAGRSNEGNFFDVTEVDDKIPEAIIAALINKRLVIKSGTKYNVYWDIFRDYLVTGNVPPIGESYILHSYVGVCLDLYLLFKNKEKMTLQDIKTIHPGNPTEGTIDNKLRVLRSIGLIKKAEEYFQLSRSGIPISEDGFRQYITEKFKKYTPYLKIIKIPDKNINIENVIIILKDIFRGISFAESTWRTYAKYLISWFKFSDLDIKSRLIDIPREPDNIHTFTPQEYPDKDIKIFRKLKDGKKVRNYNKLYSTLYDLRSIGLITYSHKIVNLTTSGAMIQKRKRLKEIKRLIALEAFKTDKIKQANILFCNNPKFTKREFIRAVSSLITSIKSEQYKEQTSFRLYEWARLIYKYKNFNIV